MPNSNYHIVVGVGTSKTTFTLVLELLRVIKKKEPVATVAYLHGLSTLISGHRRITAVVLTRYGLRLLIKLPN